MHLSLNYRDLPPKDSATDDQTEVSRKFVSRINSRDQPTVQSPIDEKENSIFISYSHKDGDYSHKLAEALEQAGIRPWVDDRIDFGSAWRYIIQKHLDICRAFIVIMTPSSFESIWVQNEISGAMRMKKPIFPLLLEGDTWLSVESI